MTSIYLFIAIIMVAALILGWFMHTRNRRRLLPLLLRQASKLQGRVTGQSSLLFLPQLHFTVHGRTLRLSFMSKSASSPETGMITCVDFPVSAGLTKLRIEEKRDAFKSALDGLVPAQGSEILFGYPDFNGRFQVTAEDPGRAGAILETGGVFRALLELPTGADFRIENGKCFLSINGLPADDAFLDKLIDIVSRIAAAVK